MFLLLFRSDTRHPDSIFPAGFSTRNPSKETLQELAPFEAGLDVVSLSRKLEATPFFPFGKDAKETWVYVVAVDNEQDAKHFLDLHSKSLSTDSEHFPFNLPFMEWPKEVDVTHIPPQHVLCAFQVERNFEKSTISDDNFCYDFVIKSEAMKNKAAVSFLEQNKKMKRQLDTVIHKYNAQINKTLFVPKPRKEKLAVAKKQSGFFMLNRLNPVKQLSIKAPISENKKPGFNTAFFEVGELGHENRLFRSTQQVRKENSLFYAAVERGLFDHRIPKEEKEIDAALKRSKEAHINHYLTQFSAEEIATAFPIIYEEDEKEIAKIAKEAEQRKLRGSL